MPPRFLMIWAAPSVDACARWAEPKASLTYNVGVLGEFLRECGIVLLFLGVEAEIFEQHDVPGCMMLMVLSTLSPMQSSTNATGRPSISARRWATGRRLCFGSRLPFGRPRWEHRMTLAPPLTR